MTRTDRKSGQLFRSYWSSSALYSEVFYCLCTFLGADQVSCRSYFGSAYRMRSLAVGHSEEREPGNEVDAVEKVNVTYAVPFSKKSQFID